MADENNAGSNPDTGDSQTSDANTDATVLTSDQGQTDDQSGEDQTADNAGDAGAEDSDTGESESAPEKYEFQAPEGMTLDQGLVDAASPIMQEIGLTQEQAQKLVGVYATHIQGQATARDDAFTKQLNDWRTELVNDKDFGGDNFDSNAGKVREFINATVPEEIKDDVFGLLQSTGAGNHPGLVKYFHSLATRFPVSEDDPGGGRPHQGRDETLGGREQRLYPNQSG